MRGLRATVDAATCPKRIEAHWIVADCLEHGETPRKKIRQEFRVQRRGFKIRSHLFPGESRLGGGGVTKEGSQNYLVGLVSGRLAGNTTHGIISKIPVRNNLVQLKPTARITVIGLSTDSPNIIDYLFQKIYININMWIDLLRQYIYFFWLQRGLENGGVCSPGGYHSIASPSKFWSQKVQRINYVLNPAACSNKFIIFCSPTLFKNFLLLRVH